ncbi:hypothetical protein MG293_018667 [Ovis ammon polii]|uniref:Uncharacterized protein n=1 Tax=Ovis ammon polii TaxID=230172 RepID=A0AAD4TR86_OVIAM|nr:hypothetical protein MG293_018667 [Ovis ammon polii]
MGLTLQRYPFSPLVDLTGEFRKNRKCNVRQHFISECLYFPSLIPCGNKTRKLGTALGINPADNDEEFKRRNIATVSLSPCDSALSPGTLAASCPQPACKTAPNIITVPENILGELLIAELSEQEISSSL